MINRNTLLIENHRFMTELESNQRRYMDFLGTMAKYHKYSLPQQMDLFFHAPANASAVATKEQWQRMGKAVREDALAIPILTGARNRETVSYVYDVRDTENYQENNSLLWQFDAEAHKEYFDRYFPKQNEEDGVKERVLNQCQKDVDDMPGISNPELTALSAAYVVLSRLGYDAEEELGIEMVMMPWQDIQPEETLDVVNQVVKTELNPLGRYIRQKEVEDARNRDSNGRQQGDSGAVGVGDVPGNVPEGSEAENVDGNADDRGGIAVPDESGGDVPGEVRENVGRVDGAGGNSRTSDNKDERLGVDAEKDPVMEPDKGNPDGGTPVVNEPEAREVFDDETIAAMKRLNEIGALDESKIQGIDDAGRYFKEIVSLANHMELAPEDEDVRRLIAEPVAKHVANLLTMWANQQSEEENMRATAFAREGVARVMEAVAQARESKEEQVETTEEPVEEVQPEPEVVDEPVSEAEKEEEQQPEEAKEEPEPVPEQPENQPEAEEKQEEPVAGQPAEPLDLSKVDYEADMSSTSGKRKVFQRNLMAIRVLKVLESEEREATPEEARLLQSYAGFGGMPEVFDANNYAWRNEYRALQQELTDSEYKAARASTLNAHFTDKELVSDIYALVQKIGFESGNVLEPSAGSGRFFAGMPETMRKDSKLFGVELDPLSSRMTAKAYPDVTMSNQGFETTTFADSSFDLAISNVPFGNYKITSDLAHRGENLYIHDYFITKMFDEVRPGGLVVAITSKGTMDKKDSTVRASFAEKGELLTAIRLPNNAFAAAGTEVTSDILIFKKYANEKERKEKREQERAKYVHNSRSQYLEYNGYWSDRPKQVLGKLETKSGPHGYEMTCTPYPDKSIHEQLQALIASIPETNQHIYTPAETPLPIPVQEVKNTDRPYGMFYEEGQLRFYEATGNVRTLELPEKQERKILSAIHLREATYAILDAQQNGCSNAELATLQRTLNQLYDDHVRRYGRIQQDKMLGKYFGLDPSYPLLKSLEVYDGKTFAHKSDVFSSRVIQPNLVPTHADTAEDALKISMTEKGKVDLTYMAGLTESTPDEIAKNLEYTSIYYDVEHQEYQLADEYLSGDVRQKIEFLEQQKIALTKKLTTVVQNQLHPLWGKPVFQSNGDEWQDLLIKTFNEDKHLYKASLHEHNDGLRYFQQHADDREFVALVAGVFDMPIRTHFNNELDFAKVGFDAERYADDPLFALQRRYYGGSSYTGVWTGEEKLKKAVKAMQLSESQEYTILHGRGRLRMDNNPSSFLANDFLMEKLAAYPKAEEGPEVEQNFLDSLAEDWQAYQKAEELKREQLVKDVKSGEPYSIQQQIDRIDKNLEALNAVKPKDLLPGEIQATLGSTWIPPKDVQDFLIETLSLYGSDRWDLKVEYSNVSGKWHIAGKNVKGNTLVDSTYGTPERNALNLCETALNLGQPKVYKEVMGDEGKLEKQLDREATMQAQMKMEDLRHAFETWLWQDKKRATRLANYYNRHFNNIRPREYNGEYLTFPGMAADVQLRPHQKDAIAHTLYGGNTLLAHCVGAGKTFEMAASAMEAKRLGIAHKSMIVVPKHLTEQTGNEYRRLYPKANILVATEKDFDKEHRKEFCAKIATQNWDAVILGYTQFERIPLSKERQTAILEQQIAEITDAMREARYAEGGRSFSVKQMEAARRKLQDNLRKLEKLDKKDQTITFEELGVDRLYIDEAHYFKNLYTPTKMSNVAGIKSSKGADRAQDLYEKCVYLNEITNGKGIVFATGTPVSNSMSELFTMQRYLQPDRLREEHLSSFDMWASTFGKTVQAMEISPEGKGFQEKTRFAKFYNLPELMSLFKEVADIKTPDMINLKVPECETIVERIPASQEQKDMVDNLADRADMVRSGAVDPTEDNMLNITNEGRLIALDPRIMDPNAPDHPESKVNRCVANVLDIYEKTTANKSTQLIFCDKSTPKNDGSFNVYDDIREKLIKHGVKPEEIAYIHDANTDKKKDDLFARVREGKVRILLGSTDKMGVGTNVQDLLIASHDLDVPWRPSDLEQRKGRIVRQGNTNPKVKIFRYVTEGTFDAYMWQLIENKQRFISQIMTSKVPTREAEDCDELTLSYAEIKACAMDNPLIKEKMEVDNDIQRLRMAKSAYEKEHSSLEHKVLVEYPKQIQQCKELIEKYEDTKMVTDNATLHDKDGKEIFSMEINGKIYNKQKEASKALQGFVDKNKMDAVKGKYKGMRFIMNYDYGDVRNGQLRLPTPQIVLMNKVSLKVPYGNPLQTVRRMDEVISNLPAQIEYQKRELAQAEHNLKIAKQELAKPFDKAELLQEKMKRAQELNDILTAKPEGEEKVEEVAMKVNEAETKVANTAWKVPGASETQWWDVYRLARLMDISNKLDEDGSMLPKRLLRMDKPDRQFMLFAVDELMQKVRELHPENPNPREWCEQINWDNGTNERCVRYMCQHGISDEATLAEMLYKHAPNQPSKEEARTLVDSVTQKIASEKQERQYA